jgi:hypothetical protein
LRSLDEPKTLLAKAPKESIGSRLSWSSSEVASALGGEST